MNTESLRSNVDKLLKRAANTLSEGLNFYWPTWGKTGAHERNISLYVGHTLLESGRYFVFGESHKRKDTKQRFDLVAVARDKSHVVACEFKQLWTPSRADSMTEDFHRLNKFKPLPWFPEGVPVIGVIAAFATAKKFVVPFDETNLCQDEFCKTTKKFCKTLRDKKKETYSLGYDDLRSEGNPSRGNPAFVYAVFEVASGSAVPSRS